jgi:hypothetical protein
MDQIKSDKKDKAAMDRAKLAADARIKAANISASKKSDGKDYEGDRAKLVDDTRSYYHEKGRHLLDPESGLIQMGTKDDPDKYVREYKKILTEMQTDMKRISNGKLPSWYKSDKNDRKVVRTGVHKGRKVAEYDDGSIEYAD